MSPSPRVSASRIGDGGQPAALDTVPAPAGDWSTLHLGDPATPLEER